MDDVKSSWPLRVGLHTCYNGSDNGLILKRCLSSDCPLQLEGMKSESLVIAYQHDAVNTFPGPCTHRPSTPWELGLPEDSVPTFGRQPATVGSATGVKS